jgi:putative FmdB family regulatory protein
MPIFEYRCDDCGGSFEKLIRRAAEKEELRCPACGKDHVTQQLSTFSAHSGGGKGKSDLPMCPSGGVCHTPGACGLN